MSSITFELQKYLLEKELDKYSYYLDTALENYTVIRPDTDEMTVYINKLKGTLTTDIGKTFEEFFMYIVVPDWKVMFDSDNFIDTGKTLTKQKEILSSLIQCIQETGSIHNFMDEETVATVNTKFLNQPYKKDILLAILQSEHNLCDDTISWKDALLERIRVMFYSGLFIADIDRVEDVIDMINSKTFKTLLPTNVISFLKSVSGLRTFNSKLTSVDLISFLIFISIGCGVSDDYMDLEEDIENNKITGVTQCIKYGIPVKHVISTTIEFLKQQVTPTEYTEQAKKWFVSLMSFMYVDLPGCLEFCKSISPYGYQIVFQRKA